MKEITVSIISLILFSQVCFAQDTQFEQTDKKLTQFDITLYKLDEPEIPNTYLKTGKIEVMPPTTTMRRFDLVYFIAMPISFYLTMGILNYKNQSFKRQDELNDIDWTYRRGYKQSQLNWPGHLNRLL